MLARFLELRVKDKEFAGYLETQMSLKMDQKKVVKVSCQVCALQFNNKKC